MGSSNSSNHSEVERKRKSVGDHGVSNIFLLDSFHGLEILLGRNKKLLD